MALQKARTLLSPRTRVKLARQSPSSFGDRSCGASWPGETVAIAIDFSRPYTGEQRYMFHCHNLEHEDQGMMLAFAVA